MSRNARAVYGVTDEQVAKAAADTPAWVANAAPEVRNAVAAAR